MYNLVNAIFCSDQLLSQSFNNYIIKRDYCSGEKDEACMQEIKSGKLQVKKIQTSAAQGIGAEGEAYYFGFSDQNGNEDGASLLSTPFVFDSELRDAMNSLEGYAFYLVTSFDDELVETDYRGLYAINKNFEAVYSEGCSDGVRIEKFDSFEALVDEAFYRLFHINAHYKPTHLGQSNILDGITKFIYLGVIEGEEAEKFAKLFSAPECREIIQAFLKKYWYDREEWESWTYCPDFLLPEVEKHENFAESRKAGWIELLSNDPRLWSQCPDELKECPDVMQACMVGNKRTESGQVFDWMENLTKDPTRWNECPGSLKKHPKIIVTCFQRWSYLLDSDPSLWRKCPAFFKKMFEDQEGCWDNHPLYLVKNYWIEELIRNPSKSVWNECPPSLQKAFKEDKQLHDKISQLWIVKLNDDPTTWNGCPDFFQQRTELIDARCVGWIGLLKRQPTTWNECPRDILQKTEVVEALKKGWVALLKDDIAAWDQCPVSIRTDAVLVETAIVGWCKGMKKITDCLKQVPEEHLQAVLWKKYSISSYAFSGFSAIVDEPQATLSLVKERWRHSPKSERANAAKALAELRNYPWNFCVLPAEQQSHPLIQEVAAQGWVSRIKEDAVFAKHVPELLLTHPKLKSFFAAKEQKEEGQVEEQILAQVKRAPGISDERLDKLGLPEGDKKLAVQIRKLRLKHWEKAIKKDWEAWERMPHSLRHDEGILTTMRETLGPQIRKNSGLWNELPDCYRQDPALQRVHKFATQAQIKCANA